MPSYLQCYRLYVDNCDDEWMDLHDKNVLLIPTPTFSCTSIPVYHVYWKLAFHGMTVCAHDSVIPTVSVPISPSLNALVLVPFPLVPRACKAATLDSHLTLFCLRTRVACLHTAF